jgi:aryl-alcohol dehydrogenase-like predicted oxidoreductase
MQYRKLPKTDLSVSAVSLGTMVFGGQTTEQEALAILTACRENGVNFIDTADMYNAGAAEEIVGKAIRGYRQDVVLATKVGYNVGSRPASLSRKYILSAIDASLKRLQTDYVDLYYLHRPDYRTDPEETLQTMNTLVQAGKIRYVGISNYASWQVMEILHICEKHHYVKPVIAENVYNLITRGVEMELIPCLEKYGIGFTVYNPIAGGFLSGKHQRGGQPAANTRFANAKNYFDRYWSDSNFDALDQIKAEADRLGLTVLQFALKWLLARQVGTSVICGVSSLEQIRQNVAAVAASCLDEQALAVCDEVWRTLSGNRFYYAR